MISKHYNRKLANPTIFVITVPIYKTCSLANDRVLSFFFYFTSQYLVVFISNMINYIVEMDPLPIFWNIERYFIINAVFYVTLLFIMGVMLSRN